MAVAPAQSHRLHVTLVPSIDPEPPYLDELDRADLVGGAGVDGSLALALPDLEPWAPAVLPAPLRLVPIALAAAPGPDDAAVASDEGDELSFDPVRTPRGELPAPAPYAARLARLVLEVLAGDRPVRQLTRCIAADVFDELALQVSPRSPRPWAGTVRRIITCEPVPGVAEVTAIVTRGARTIALALRLEGIDGRWQLTALQIG